jgi:hypothetical protein
MRAVFSLILKILCVCLLITGCSDKISKQELEFYYYPKKNVYFDVDKKKYFYSLDGAKTWAGMESTDAKEPATLGEKVVIYSDSAQVYKENATHRKLYAGNLYNIILGDVSTTMTTEEVSERKIIQKRKVVSGKGKVEEKPKKGIGKFIQKIFGKKDKK